MNKFPQRLFSEQTERAICDYYWTRLSSGYYPSYKETGEAFDCSPAHVRNLLKKYGYKRRTQAETREKRPCKQPHERGEAPFCACGCGNPVTWDTSNKRWFKYFPGHYSGANRKIVQPHLGKPVARSASQLTYESSSKAPLYEIVDYDQLVTLYVEKCHTVSEVAEILGIGVKTASRALRYHNIPLRTLSESLVLRGSMSKSNNPAWKGGVAQWEYSSDWKRICKQVKDRDQWTCQLCGEQRKRWGHKLHVHHIDGDKLNNHPYNLIALCSACHHPIHNDETIRAKLTKIAIANTG